MSHVKLNLGCGRETPEGWLNVDWSLGAKLAKLPLFRSFNKKTGLLGIDWDANIYLHDLTKPFPWGSGSTEVVYSSHTLEHLDRAQGRAFLLECFRVLRPGGILRVVVPDLTTFVAKYQAGEFPADEFVERLGVFSHQAHDGPIKRRLGMLFRFPHQCMYDEENLLRVFQESGFDRPRARGSLESEIEGIANIELPERTKGSVIVEASKP